MSKLDRYKLESTFGDGTVVHTTYRTNLEAGQRNTPVQTTWTEGDTLGSGGFGVVTIHRSDGGEVRAVKKILKGIGKIDYSREVTILTKVADYNHLFVQFLGWYENRDCIFIAMEYIQHGDLSNYLKMPSPRSSVDIREITRQLLEGLAILHQLQITHRDLKPQNVLIASLEPIWVKIADFGASKRTKGTALHTQIGTRGYTAPEILGLITPGENSGGYNNGVDMWSLGCVVHELLTTEIPFLEAGHTETLMSGLDTEVVNVIPQPNFRALKAFCDGKTNFPTEILRLSGASDAAVAFVKSLLIPIPGSRAAAERALQSQWLFQEEDHVSQRLKLTMESSASDMHMPQAITEWEFNSQWPHDDSGYGIQKVQSRGGPSRSITTAPAQSAIAGDKQDE